MFRLYVRHDVEDFAVGVFMDADPGLDVMAAVAAGGDLNHWFSGYSENADLIKELGVVGEGVHTGAGNSRDVSDTPWKLDGLA